MVERVAHPGESWPGITQITQEGHRVRRKNSESGTPGDEEVVGGVRDQR